MDKCYYVNMYVYIYMHVECMHVYIYKCTYTYAYIYYKIFIQEKSSTIMSPIKNAFRYISPKIIS